MQEARRFFREARALKAFVVGVMCLCIGLVSWKDMDRQGRVFWLIITPVAFISSLVSYWYSRPKRHKHHAISGPGIERRNPPAILPPRRDR
jgi:hypothetical protein